MISIDLIQIKTLNDLNKFQIDRLTKQNSQMWLIINEFLELMDNSKGVSGLHLNGDIATWNWLRSNGWLSELDKHLGE